MKLYDSTRAPGPRRVRIFAAEKGIALDLVPIDLGKLEHWTPEFTKVNPWQGIPALELDDGTVISETVAICRYLEALQPEPHMFGRTAKEQGVVEMWNRRIELGLFTHITNAFRHAHPAMAEREKPQVAEWAEVSRSRANEQLAVLDKHLADHEFAAGSSYSIADITLMVAIDFMRLPKIAMTEDMIHLRRWHAMVAARPSAEA
jgi:glutathione S-transferase